MLRVWSANSRITKFGSGLDHIIPSTSPTLIFYKLHRIQGLSYVTVTTFIAYSKRAVQRVVRACGAEWDR